MNKFSLILAASTCLASAQNAKAYCWKFMSKSDHTDRYACYGPSKLANSSYMELQDALFAVGCEQGVPRPLTQYGAKQGEWFDCKSLLGNGDHAPLEIEEWLQNKSKP